MHSPPLPTAAPGPIAPDPGGACAAVPLASRAARALREPLAILLTGALAAAAPLAQAEKADRSQPLTIEADKTSTVDLAKRVVSFHGRVLLTQGSLRIQADRMDVTEVAGGHRTALARGLAEQPAQFREKRDGVDEFVEGRAQLIEYDSREEVMRLTGQAVVRRLRGTQLADEIQGEVIIWNGSKEVFSVAPASPSLSDGRGNRVRAVIVPAPRAEPAPPVAPPRR